MLVLSVRLALAGMLAAEPVAVTVPPPRPVGATPSRPPPARPIAVATVGVGVLTLASSIAVLGLGIHTMNLAPQGRTEGEANAYVHNGKNLVVIGSALTSVGVALLVGGIVWVVRDRRRPRPALARR